MKYFVQSPAAESGSGEIEAKVSLIPMVMTFVLHHAKHRHSLKIFFLKKA